MIRGLWFELFCRRKLSLEHKFWTKFGSKDSLARKSSEYEPIRNSLAQSTLNPGGKHSHFFRPGELSRLLADHGFIILKRRNNTIFARNLIGLLVREIDIFLDWNARAADKLPGFIAADWLIAAQVPNNIQPQTWHKKRRKQLSPIYPRTRPKLKQRSRNAKAI